MRLAAILRHRRGLLMQLGSSSNASGTQHLKRSFARQAFAHEQSQDHDSYNAESPRPGKAPRRNGSPNPDMPSTSSRGGGGFGLRGRHSGGGGPSARGHGRHQSASNGRSSKRGPQRPQLPILDGPLHDQKFLNDSHTIKLSAAHAENPKSVLANYVTSLGQKAEYTHSNGVVGPDRTQVNRCVVTLSSLSLLCCSPVCRAHVTIQLEVEGHESIVGIGDDAKSKEAEKLAAADALLQLRELGLVSTHG